MRQLSRALTLHLRHAIHNGLIDGARLESDLQSEFTRTVDSIYDRVEETIMGMFEDGLDEGMRLTRALMLKEGIDYNTASARIRSMAPPKAPNRDFQRELYNARGTLDLLRAKATMLEADTRYVMEEINEIKRSAGAAGEDIR